MMLCKFFAKRVEINIKMWYNKKALSRNEKNYEIEKAEKGGRKMNYTFIHYPKCTTCQRAKKYLDDNKIKYTEKHIVTETPSYDELKAIIEASGLPVSKFFNTSGLLYRSMNLKEELKNCSDDDKIRLLASNGMLIKRPLLIKKEKVLVGFKEEEWKELK